MIFFKNAILETVKEYKVKNDMGMVVKSYMKTGNKYNVNIQPVDAKSYKYTWGEDIKSTLQVYSDVDLKVADIISINSKCYKIEKKIDWIDYKIYAILETDVILQC